MPHLRLEHSPNLIEKDTIADLFPAIHALLTEQLPTKMRSCKSRAIECQHRHLGDGSVPGMFVHVELKLLKGRTSETLTLVGANLMDLLQQHFAKSAAASVLDISLEIIEIGDAYFKWSSEKEA
jgi:5-carboxymethyl-2-hydroxymuconate isomerase